MKLWSYFLGAWLILYSLDKLVNLNFQYETIVMGLLALVTGILVILRK